MRGYFGIGIYNPKTEVNVGTLWRSAFLFGASFVFTIGKRYGKQRGDTPDTAKHIPLYHFTTYREFEKFIPYRCQVLCIEQNKKSKSLKITYHPEQAIYLLGAEDKGLPEKIMRGKQIIEIPTEKPYSMNVAIAGSIIMYDRFSK